MWKESWSRLCPHGVFQNHACLLDHNSIVVCPQIQRECLIILVVKDPTLHKWQFGFFLLVSQGQSLSQRLQNCNEKHSLKSDQEINQEIMTARVLCPPPTLSPLPPSLPWDNPWGKLITCALDKQSLEQIDDLWLHANDNLTLRCGRMWLLAEGVCYPIEGNSLKGFK